MCRLSSRCVNRKSVRVGAALVVLGAIPGLVPSSVPGGTVANSTGVVLAGGVLMLAGAAVLAVAWWQDTTAVESETGDVSG